MGNFKFFTVFLFSFLFSVLGYGQEILLNGGFESGVAKWKSYCDAAGTAPVDGVGGGVAGFTITASTTSPLAGKSSGIITKDAANRQGCGVASDFTLATENKAKVLQIKLSYQVASGTYADDQYKVYVYDVDNAQMIEAAPTFIKNSLLVEQYRGVFQATLSGTNYRLIIHNASTSAVASTLKIEASISGQLIAVGNYETDWITYSPTFSGMGTVTNSLAQYRLVGDMMQIKISGKTGTVTTADCRFTLPGGFSPDTAKMTSTRTHKYGDVSRIYNSSTPATLLSAFYNSTYPNEVSLSPNSVSGTYTQLGCDSMFTSTDAFASSDIFVPILGRGSNSRLSSEYSARSAALFATISSYTHSSSGSLQVITGWSGSDNLGAWNASTGVYTCPFSGFYKVSATIGYGTSTSGARYLALRRNSTDVAYGDQKNAANFGAGATVTTSLAAGVQCNAGETLSIRAFQNSGGNLAFTTGVESNLTISLDTGGTQVVSADLVSASYESSAGQSIPNSSLTIWNLATKIEDSHNAVTTGGSWKFTAPISGLYQVSCNWNFATGSYGGTSNFQCALYKNGSQFRKLGFIRTENGSASIAPSSSGTTLIRLNAGDYIDFRLFQDNGSSASLEASGVNNHISIVRVGN